MIYALVLVILPITVVLTSILFSILTKKWFVMPLITFLILSLVMVSIFNTTFFIWVALFTILSLVVSFLSLFTRKLIITHR
ncbi:DUF2651 family protein [Virgibacillus sp. 6R]|uniref:DUF2651 family protein n=1 Tax=Metabacillus sp. 22489 TaxID=3453928 RepID=UPI00164256A0